MSTAYTVAEVAERLHVHPDTVRDLIRSGELSAFNASANPTSRKPRYRVTVDALAGFLARRSVQTPSKLAKTRKPALRFTRFV